MTKEPPLRSKKYFRSMSDEELANWKSTGWPMINYGINLQRHEREMRRRRASKSKVSIAQADAQGEP